MIYHQEHKIQVFEAHIKQNPKWAKVALGFANGLRQQYYNADFLCHHYRGHYDIYDGLLFGLLWHAHHAGIIARADLYVGHSPSGDKMIEENNKKLENLKLCGPFSGNFWGGTQDADGFIEWNKSIVLRSEGNYVSGHTDIKYRPERIPLEVGYQQIAKTFHQLAYGRRLARWPYDTNYIHVMYICDDSWFNTNEFPYKSRLNPSCNSNET